MPGKIESKTIDGLDVKTAQFSCLESLRLLKRVGAAIAPAFSAAAAAGITGSDNVAKLGPAIAAMLERLEDPDALICAVLRQTIVTHEGKAIALTDPSLVDYVFTGRIGTVLKVAAFALEVNYGDFIGAALASAKALAAEQGAASPSA